MFYTAIFLKTEDCKAMGQVGLTLR